MSGLTPLFDNGGFKYFAEIEPTFWDKKTGYTMDIYSRRESAKKPSGARQCFFACLDREGLENLGKLIEAQLNKYKAEYSDEEERQHRKRSGDMGRMLSTVFRNGADLSGKDTP